MIKFSQILNSFSELFTGKISITVFVFKKFGIILNSEQNKRKPFVCRNEERIAVEFCFIFLDAS